MHRISFTYEGRKDAFSAWEFGDEKELKHRLARIEISSNAALLRQYKLDYEDVGKAQFSRLKSISLCTDTDCAPPTVFDWKKTEDSRDQTIDIAESVEEIVTLKATNYASSQIADLNRDGKPDVCILKGGLKCALNGADGKMGALKSWTNALNDNYWHHPARAATFNLVDLNDDGLPDYCIQDEKGTYCGINQGSTGFTDHKQWTSYVKKEDIARFNDINGDGYTDICRFKEDQIECSLNQQGNGFAVPKQLIAEAWPLEYGQDKDKVTNGSTAFLDINGDGLDDICGADDDGFSCFLNEGYRKGELSQYSERVTWHNDIGRTWNKVKFSNTLRYTDLNADGLTDICYRDESDDYQCAINTSEKFNDATKWASAASWHSDNFASSTLRLVDITGDGRDDLCLSPAGRTWSCSANLGDHFAPELQRYADLRYSDDVFKADGENHIQPFANPITFSDIDANGTTDLCYRGYQGISCALGNSVEHGMLIGIKSAFGNQYLRQF